LDLSGNEVDVIQASLFDSSPKLESIFLAGNDVSRINDGAFGLLTHLQTLDMVLSVMNGNATWIKIGTSLFKNQICPGANAIVLIIFTKN
jgi:hypothetical protein